VTTGDEGSQPASPLFMVLGRLLRYHGVESRTLVGRHASNPTEPHGLNGEWPSVGSFGNSHQLRLTEEGQRTGY